MTSSCITYFMYVILCPKINFTWTFTMFFAEEQDHLCFKKGLGCRKKTFCFWFVFDKKKPFHSITTHEMSVKRKKKKNPKKKKKEKIYDSSSYYFIWHRTYTKILNKLNVSVRCGIIGKLFFLWSACVISELSSNPEVKVTNTH